MLHKDHIGLTNEVVTNAICDVGALIICNVWIEFHKQRFFWHTVNEFIAFNILLVVLFITKIVVKQVLHHFLVLL